MTTPIAERVAGQTAAAQFKEISRRERRSPARGWRSSFDPLDVAQFTFDEIKAAPNRGWAPRGGKARVGGTAARP